MDYNFSARLTELTTRPFIRIPFLRRMRILIDTGADIPMWVGDLRALLMLGATTENEVFYFAGAAGTSTSVVYYLHNVQLKGLTYEKVPILQRNTLKDEAPHFMFPASMMYKTELIIDFSENKLVF